MEVQSQIIDRNIKKMQNFHALAQAGLILQRNILQFLLFIKKLTYSNINILEHAYKTKFSKILGRC